MISRALLFTVASLLMAYQTRAQVLTTGEPATATKTKYVLPSDPKSMTVADEGASSGYIIGKRVDPDKPKKQARSPGKPSTTQATTPGSTTLATGRTDTTSVTRKTRTTRKSRTSRKPTN